MKFHFAKYGVYPKNYKELYFAQQDRWNTWIIDKVTFSWFSEIIKKGFCAEVQDLRK